MKASISFSFHFIPNCKQVVAVVPVVFSQRLPWAWASLNRWGFASGWDSRLTRKACSVTQVSLNSHLNSTAETAEEKMAACPDKQVAANLTFWVCSFHGSFCSRRGMLLGRRVTASCTVTLCKGLLPRNLDAGPAGPFSWCHGNQLALRPRSRGAAWSAHATTAAANISNKKSKAYSRNRNKVRSHALTMQSNTCSHTQPPSWGDVIFPFTQTFCLPHPYPRRGTGPNSKLFPCLMKRHFGVSEGLKDPLLWGQKAQ